MGKENLYGAIRVHMMVSFIKTIFMVMENMNGQMAEFTMVNG